MGKDEDSWRRVFDDLVKLIEAAPPPPHRLVGDWTRKDQTEAHAIAVAWGWLIRLKRTGEAIFELEKSGYGTEAAPLVRSTIEHAIRLSWAADLGRQQFVEILIRMRRWSLQKILDAANAGWPLTEDQIEQIRDLQDEAGEEFKGLDKFMQLAAVVAENLELFSGLYQIWLSETQESHPSLQSSANYREQSEDCLTWALHREPKPSRRRNDVLVPSLVWMGLHGYARIAGMEAHFAEGIEGIGARMEVLGVSP
ncbi:hypothetical protein GCM10023063_17820 [Arthrobacter methylotrophus]|uniref:DUF5677 domain-containing protein n=1 Tax=Arthrobacter methylotrophus TaxID=121291 RepID=A0ABV5UNW6_9MICC